MRGHVFVLIVAGVGLCIGCSRAPGVEGVVPVSGSVTYQGKPVEGASVMFAPEAAGGRSASGITGADGRFQLTTLKADDGALCGRYKVAVSKVQVENSMTAEEMTKAMTSSGDARKQFENKGGPAKTDAKDELPEDYKTAESSGLTAEVTEGGENDFTFDLK